MKRHIKIISLALVVVFMFGVISVCASDVPVTGKTTDNNKKAIMVIDETIVSPYAKTCGHCGKDSLKTVQDGYGARYSSGVQRYCTHKLLGVDVQKRRSVYMKTYCTNCLDVSYRFQEGEEVIFECRGTNQ